MKGRDMTLENPEQITRSDGDGERAADGRMYNHMRLSRDQTRKEKGESVSTAEVQSLTSN